MKQDAATLDKRYAIHPVTAMIHDAVAFRIDALDDCPSSILDIGGTGKLVHFVQCGVTDANIKTGDDGCCLRFADDSFDVSVSIATLEHVNDQRRFLEESLRVAKLASIHWFPYGEDAAIVERFKKRFTTYSHPCAVPTGLGDEWEVNPYVTVAEHLLLLATLYDEMNCPETYRVVRCIGRRPYGVIAQRLK